MDPLPLVYVDTSVALAHLLSEDRRPPEMLWQTVAGLQSAPCATRWRSVCPTWTSVRRSGLPARRYSAALRRWISSAPSSNTRSPRVLGGPADVGRPPLWPAPGSLSPRERQSSWLRTTGAWPTRLTWLGYPWPTGSSGPKSPAPPRARPSDPNPSGSGTESVTRPHRAAPDGAFGPAFSLVQGEHRPSPQEKAT